MSNRVVTNNSINPNATIAPGVVVIEQLTPGSVAGVPTNLGGFSGTANWGEVGAPVTVASDSDYANQLGDVLNETFNIGTAVNAATLQGQVGNYVCVRVTDGTDTNASSDILDSQSVPAIGAIFTAKYSGAVGNTLQATVTTGTAANAFNVSVGRPNYVAENYTNIPSSGAGFWANLISAINNGQSGIRGPSELVIASSGNGVANITITNPGSGFTGIPSVGFTGGGGSGAAGNAIMKALTATPATPQSGIGSYAPSDTVTLAGATGTEPVLTVATTQVVSATVNAGGSGGTPGTATVTGTTGTGTKFQALVTISGGGAITSVNSISVPGDYVTNPLSLSAEPVTGASLTGATLTLKMGVSTAVVSTPGALSVLSSSPVAQGSTSGSGTGATFTLTYGVQSIAMTNRGTGYATPPSIGFTSGGGSGAAATASLISISPPSTTNNPYTFSGGTNGNTGVTATSLLGTNTAIPTGMYALINTNVSLFALVDDDDVSTFTDQVAFAQVTGAQCVLVGEPNQTVAEAITVKSGAGIVSNSAITLVGDWCYYLDVDNGGITRMISPQGFYVGKMANLSPEQSPLNKPMNGILATQKSIQQQIYSDSDVVNMMLNGLDVISSPQPGGNYFASTTGKASGLDPSNNNVPVQRMANFIGLSIGKSGVIGAYIGQLNSPTVRRKARGALSAFLRNLQSRQQIQAFQVILNETNNPNSRVVLGFMQAQVTVQLFSIIIVFLIDLNVGTVTISS